MQPWDLLTEFNKQDVRGNSTSFTANAADRGRLREALLAVRQQAHPDASWDPASPDLLLGVLSSDVRMAVRAMRDWTQALDVEFVPPVSRVRLRSRCSPGGCTPRHSHTAPHGRLRMVGPRGRFLCPISVPLSLRCAGWLSVWDVDVRASLKLP